MCMQLPCDTGKLHLGVVQAGVVYAEVSGVVSAGVV